MADQSKTPIIYEDLVDIRFSDLDHYNHVNSKHYIDFVSSARLNFLAREMKVTIEQVTERGVGFYLTRTTVNYKKPIIGLQKVRVKSHVSDVRAGLQIVVPFELKTEDDTKLFADGTMEYTMIDLKTKSLTSVPRWILDLFFK